MSVTVTSIVKNSDSSWTFAWTSTSPPPYRVVLWGETLATVGELTYTHNGYGNDAEPPPLEFVEDELKAISELNPAKFVLQWYAEPGVSHYRVEKNVSGVWTTVATIQEAGEWVYTYESRVVEDDTVHDYRVTAVDALGNESTPALYEGRIVRRPDPPSGLTFTYDPAFSSLTISP